MQKQNRFIDEKTYMYESGLRQPLQFTVFPATPFFLAVNLLDLKCSLSHKI